MTDRAMLEAAAKAAGIEVVLCDDGMWVYAHGQRGPDNSQQWAPLDDDGDSKRLMVACRIDVDFYTRDDDLECVCAAVPGLAVHEELGADADAATRRAIFRAAAEIGRNMP